MDKVIRLHPESKTSLINWIEENFDEIEQFIVTFTLRDGTTMTVYDSYSYLNALGIVAMTMDTIQKLQLDGEFVPKKEK